MHKIHLLITLSQLLYLVTKKNEICYNLKQIV